MVIICISGTTVEVCKYHVFIYEKYTTVSFAEDTTCGDIRSLI